MRVFELAKEFQIPAKDLMHKIRRIGIPAANHFNALSDEQVQKIRTVLKKTAPSGSSASSQKGSASSGVKRRRVRKTTKEDPFADPATQRRARRVRRTKHDETPEPAEVQTAVQEPVTTTKEESPAASIPEKKETEAKEKRPQIVVGKKPVPVAAVEVKKTPVIEKKTPPAPVAPSSKSEPPKAVATPVPTSKRPERQVPTPRPQKKSEKKGSKASKITKRTAQNQEKPAHAQDSRKGKSSRGGYGGQNQQGSFRRKDLRRRDKRNRKQQEPEVPKHVFNPRKKSIKIGNVVTVAELAGLIGIKVPEILKVLMQMGTMVTINQNISGEMAALVAVEFDIEVEQDNSSIEDVLEEQLKQELPQKSRCPVLTVMGHVDHGKTSLLDKIRETSVADRESGGITQHIGAYHVEAEAGDLTFLDTPGHEAFTAMRARGASVTDIVILVIAADDCVQPQTIEAIHHAQAAEVPILVALNKMDRPEANPNKIKQELLEHQLIAEELGGDTTFIPVSAKTGEGIDELLEMVQLQAELLELQSPFAGNASGIVIESKISKGHGAVATILVQRGTLEVGNFFVCGDTYGRVRAMFNENHQSVQTAGPSFPVEIAGLNESAETGSLFVVLDDERATRQIAERRSQQSRERSMAANIQKTSLDNIFSQLEEKDNVELKLLIKADVQGSVEAIKSALSQLGNEKVSVRFIHAAVGNITETDVALAAASDAIILGFNASADSKAKAAASQEGVEVRLYTVIYSAIDDVKAGLQGLLAPEIREEVTGHCEVRKVYGASKTGMILGGYVTSGRLLRGGLIRVLRAGNSVFEGELISLKRFKDDVKEVLNNYECGFMIDFPEIQEGDIVETYKEIEEAATL